MRRIPSAEFVRRFSAISDEALAEPIVLTRNGRDRLVLLSIEAYQRLVRMALSDVEERSDIKDMAEELRRLLGEDADAGAERPAKVAPRKAAR